MLRNTDDKFMRRALELARLGLGLASPNPSVGCVLVRDGRIVGEGFHEYEKKDHAEVLAVRQAGRRARGATAYISLEPCSHHGRTPPCSDLLIRSGIRRAVVGEVDPNPRVCGKGIEALTGAGIQVDAGLMRVVARRIIEPFACHMRTGRPLVVAKVGMTLDGRIAPAHTGGSRISSTEASEFGQSLRHQLDAILVGVGTVLADDPRLTYRGSARKARPLLRAILDCNLRTPVGAGIFREDPVQPIVIFCKPDASKARRRELEKAGAEIVPAPSLRGKLDLDAVLAELGRRRVLGVLVEGGSTVHWSFVSEKRVDKFYFDVAPLILGGMDSVPAVGGKGYGSVQAAPRFKITGYFDAGSDLILETYPVYSRSIASPWQRAADVP